MNILTLRVEIDGITPAIWRRIEVGADASLRGLHRLIQAAFGWSGYCQHEFIVDGRAYAGLAEERVLDGRLPGQRFAYRYDFVDQWRHTITVEHVAPGVCRCGKVLDGRGACPPEGVGGPLGYEEYLEAMLED